MTLRLILVDDQEMYRLGFRMLLETQEGVEVVGEAEDGHAAVDLIDRVEADIVLMDVRMPRMNGIDATRARTSRSRAVRSSRARNLSSPSSITGGGRVKCSMSLRVVEGAMTASPACTWWIAAMSSSRDASLRRKPLAPARIAS